VYVRLDKQLSLLYDWYKC